MPVRLILCLELLHLAFERLDAPFGLGVLLGHLPSETSLRG
jgi:hypothetical protein